jgi:hypothetical protein
MQIKYFSSHDSVSIIINIYCCQLRKQDRRTLTMPCFVRYQHMRKLFYYKLEVTEINSTAFFFSTLIIDCCLRKTTQSELSANNLSHILTQAWYRNLVIIV